MSQEKLADFEAGYKKYSKVKDQSLQIAIQEARKLLAILPESAKSRSALSLSDETVKGRANESKKVSI